MNISNVFSTKRQAIDKAKSTVFVAMVIASILVSFSIVTINFLWGLRGYNTRVTAEKESVRDTLEENISNAEALRQSFSTFESGDVTSKEVLDALPSKYDFAAIITSLDSLAKRSGMLLTGFTGDDQSAEAMQSSTRPEAIAIPFTIEVEGDYEGLQEFMNNLELSIRPMQVESVEISGSDENITANISISTFYQPQASLDVETKVVE